VFCPSEQCSFESFMCLKKTSALARILLLGDVIELHLSTRHQMRAVGEASSHGEALDAGAEATSESEHL